MRKSISVTAGCLVAAVLTHGLVSSGVNLTGADRLSFFTYRGFFTHVIFGFWRLWALVRGSTSDSILHARPDELEPFGRFLAITVLLTFPLIGFAVSAFSSRQRICWQWLCPLAIATILALWDVLIPIHVYELRHITLRQPFVSLGIGVEFAEASRAIVVTLLMLWSVGGLQPRKLQGQDPVELTAPGPV